MRRHKSSIAVYICTNRIYRPKKYFYVSLGNTFFTVFCGGPLVVEALGNCPVCPLPLNPALGVKLKQSRSRESYTLSILCNKNAADVASELIDHSLTM